MSLIKRLLTLWFQAHRPADASHSTPGEMTSDLRSESFKKVSRDTILTSFPRVLLLSPLSSLQFPITSVLQCSSHQDNKRLFGFVLQAAGGGRGDSRTVCYIFESNNDGEKVVNPRSLVPSVKAHCLTRPSSSSRVFRSATASASPSRSPSTPRW